MFTIYANYYVTEVESEGAEKVLESAGIDLHGTSHLDPQGQAAGSGKPDATASKLKSAGWFSRLVAKIRNKREKQAFSGLVVAPVSRDFEDSKKHIEKKKNKITPT